MPDLPPFLHACLVGHDGMGALLLRVKYNGQSLVETTMLGLHSSQIELLGGMATLLANRRFTGVPVLYRSFLDATVDLRALVRDPDFARCRLLRYYNEGVRIAKAASSLEPITDETRNTLATAQTHMQEQAKELRALGATSPTVGERFKLADFSIHYVDYMQASLAVHSGQSALLDRHADHKGEAPGISLLLYKDIHLEDFRETMVKALCFGLESAHEVHEHFQTGLAHVVDALALDCERAMGPRAT